MLSSEPALAESTSAKPSEEMTALAAETLRRATRFFRNEVAVQGSYLWRYSEDLEERRGEGRASATQGWAQPPGTPAIGMAFLRAYGATGDRLHLDGAIEAAHALAATQLQSGGWYYSIEFDPDERESWCYRMPPSGCHDRSNRNRNNSTVDDNTSQSALRLLMLVDRILDGEDPVINEAVTYGLARFMEAQYPNGAWAVGSRHRVPDDAAPEVGPARYPASWPRTYEELSKPFYPTNDHVMRDMIRTFLLAYRLYGRDDYKTTALRGGQFLLDAQMPAPQSGWAQTYNAAMEPVWGRKFEPPGVVSWETVGVIEVLLDLYLYTGDQRYLDSATAGIDWLDRSRLPGGDWARFYEMRTNRPLYMTRDYRLTYDGDDPPRHYRFRGTFEVDRVRQIHRDIVAKGRDLYLAGLSGAGETRPARTNEHREVAAIIDRLDAKGRWLSDGRIDSKTFIRNYETLSDYIASRRSPAEAERQTRQLAAIADPMGFQMHAEVFSLPSPSDASGAMMKPARAAPSGGEVRDNNG
ncbi:MAG: hypothetical protein AAF637_05135 [Pseudomonadota bacterium]